MRIGIDASPIVGDRGGVGWHTYYLLQAMLAAKRDVEFIAYVRPGATPPEEVHSWPGADLVRWVQASKWMMRWRGRSDGLDLYHGLNFRMHTTGRCGGLVTIHDLWLERFPQYSPKLLGQKLSSWKTKRTARGAKKVVTVSEFSAHELAELFGLPQGRIAVIPNGVSEEWRPRRDDTAMRQLRQRIGLADRPFILFVGGADPRKNHRVFLEAVALVRRQLRGRTLLLAGSPTHPFGSYMDTAKANGLANDVLCPGRFSKEDLQLLYSYSDLFVFPSLYEGFGMPVIEAMACGAPVITSSTTALGEIAGDAALLVDPQDARAMGEAMIRLLNDATLRPSLIAKGLARATRYTWQRAATMTLDLYASLCH